MESTFQSRAILRRVRLSPRKARLVADLVRGDDYITAEEKLRFSNLKAAKIIKKSYRFCLFKRRGKS